MEKHVGRPHRQRLVEHASLVRFVLDTITVMRLTLSRSSGILGAVTFVVLAVSAMIACGDATFDAASNDGGNEASADGGDGSTSGDASNLGDGAVAPGDFTFSVTPSHITADTSDNIPVTILVTRGASFTDAIDFAITTPLGITATGAASTGTGGTSSGFTVTDVSALDGDAKIIITAADSNVTLNLVHQVTLGVRVGSLLDVSDGGLLVPDYATGLIATAWGAGGGSAIDDDSQAANGGGGGFASATLAVTPGAFFIVSVGTGGSGLHTQDGAGGGGYSAICPPSGACLLIAGGGGGAGAGSNTTIGGAGGAGGGASGADGEPSTTCGTTSTGGTQSAGGTAASCAITGVDGVSLQGGAGAGTGTAQNFGGVPGGGNGGNGAAGGGGGGYFGGGGGSWDNTDGAGGGGGGSGYVSADGGTLTAGSGINPGATPDATCPGNAGGGGTNGEAGGPGCVVVHLAKP